MSFLSPDITPAHLQKQVTIINATIRQLTKRIETLETNLVTQQPQQTQQTQQTQQSTADDEDTCTLQ